jgi:hypothetical protein
MRATNIVAAVSVCALALLLAGCTSSATPKPTATAVSAAAKCTPKTAKIQWYPASHPNTHSAKFYVPVQVQVYDYTKSTAEPKESIFDVFPTARVAYSAHAAAQWTTTGTEAWRKALTESASLTGQVNPGFGVPSKAANVDLDPLVHKGIQLRVVEQPSQVITFAIRCAGQDGVFGHITGIDQAGVLSVNVDCADPKAQKNAEVEYVRAHALAPTYCPAAS